MSNTVHTERLRASHGPDENVFQAMKLTEFAEWLRAQPADRQYPQSDGDPISEACPIACFCDHASAEAMAGMPLWASRFIRLFDNQEPPRTQAKALAVLAEVEREFLSDETRLTSESK